MYISVEENIRIEFDRFYEALKFHGHNIENDVSDLLNILEENIKWLKMVDLAATG